MKRESRRKCESDGILWRKSANVYEIVLIRAMDSTTSAVLAATSLGWNMRTLLISYSLWSSLLNQLEHTDRNFRKKSACVWVCVSVWTCARRGASLQNQITGNKCAGRKRPKTIWIVTNLCVFCDIFTEPSDKNWCV